VSPRLSLRRRAPSRPRQETPPTQFRSVDHSGRRRHFVASGNGWPRALGRILREYGLSPGSRPPCRQFARCAYAAPCPCNAPSFFVSPALGRVRAVAHRAAPRALKLRLNCGTPMPAPVPLGQPRSRLRRSLRWPMRMAVEATARRPRQSRCLLPDPSHPAPMRGPELGGQALRETQASRIRPAAAPRPRGAPKAAGLQGLGRLARRRPPVVATRASFRRNAAARRR
jgi:hypothetical protein